MSTNCAFISSTQLHHPATAVFARQREAAFQHQSAPTLSDTDSVSHPFVLPDHRPASATSAFSNLAAAAYPKKRQHSASASAPAALPQQHAFSISSAPARRRHEHTMHAFQQSQRCDWPYIGGIGNNGGNRHRQHATSAATPPFSILRVGNYSATLISAFSAHTADVIALAS